MTYETKQKAEKVILVGVFEKNSLEDEIALEELSELTRTAGAEVIGYLCQNREAAHAGHYLGKGKLDELKIMVNATDANGIICDSELTSSQMKNMEKVLHCKIMDRTMLILDIFAGRAISVEGKMQVELAQLKYNLSHLVGIGTELSRIGGRSVGGGIGTRGPGEKKLETDRRYIRNNINELNKTLKEVSVNRETQRRRREKNSIPIVSMVGYTNAGKSTLLNKLSNAGVLAEDKLFATLDTTTRKIELTNGSEILFTDTVGFIKKLPHQLISAFRATLEELNYADILIHVVDASNEHREEQMQAVYQTLTQLNCIDKPIITVYNKMDREIELPLPADLHAIETSQISAFSGEGLEEFLTTIEHVLAKHRSRLFIILPYTEGKLLNSIHSSCEILQEKHMDSGTYLDLYADNELKNKLIEFMCEEKLSV